ncbi:MAG TPA: hypothetical protein VML56_03600 [Burkholderiales bacterium]|nr:hypothetical protein [Burkholderiales bacterium]
MSLETPGVASANPNSSEDTFQNLWDKGAFNADGKPDPAQGQAEDSPAAAASPQQATTLSGEPEQAQAQQRATQETEGPDYANLDDYLQKSGVERDSFYDLPVTVKIGGESKLVPLRDALRSYQQEGDYTRKSQELANRQREWDTQQAQARQAMETQLGQAKALGDLAHQQLLGEYQRIDWNALRATDPAQWAVLNTEFNQRAAAIQQHLAAVAQRQQELSLEQQQQVLKQLPVERDKMLEARPEWRDETKFTAARAEMTSYAHKMGFSDAEIGNIFDHRIMLALHDASRFAALQAQAPQAVKRVRAAPQVANPGARISRDPEAVARTQLRDQFRKNPRDQDTAARYFGTLA